MTDGAIGIDRLVAWLQEFTDLVTENRQYLTELDSAIGDADHGANMARGMAAVMAKVGSDSPATADELFKGVGMTLVTTVGGASGPLYGTFFLRFGMTAGAVTEFDAASLGQALRAGFEGVLARGKAEPGDKTMVDAMGPAVEAFEKSAGEGVAAAAAAASAAAEEGRDSTTPLVARKGRASYLGERSAGHLDPGATSTSYLFQSLAEALG